MPKRIDTTGLQLDLHIGDDEFAPMELSEIDELRDRAVRGIELVMRMPAGTRRDEATAAVRRAVATIENAQPEPLTNKFAILLATAIDSVGRLGSPLLEPTPILEPAVRKAVSALIEYFATEDVNKVLHDDGRVQTLVRAAELRRSGAPDEKWLQLVIDVAQRVDGGTTNDANNFARTWRRTRGVRDKG